ncbi:proton-conducting transporter transmembrane domain-containing protein [Aliidiomarina celeris]|uniref:proton-conducting transporter transmembrane domain-containing protein n=1 Tax=Aliidiomarina celeris TaxID=2249428 RepID=UPI0022B7F145|nr:proton-conducting transporter membrane subunit [Aliidiomarina celeris]
MCQSALCWRAFAKYSQPSLAAALFYLLHTTLLTAVFFLLADIFHHYRPGPRDYFVTGPRSQDRVLLGGLFFTAAVAFAGLPPLSGFISKFWILQSTTAPWAYALFWPILLISSLIIIIALSRGGSALLWRQNKQPATTERAPILATGIVLTMLFGSLLLSIFAQPIMDYTQNTAAQILAPERYIHAVLGGLADANH